MPHIEKNHAELLAHIDSIKLLHVEHTEQARNTSRELHNRLDRLFKAIDIMFAQWDAQDKQIK